VCIFAAGGGGEVRAGGGFNFFFEIGLPFDTILLSVRNTSHDRLIFEFRFLILFLDELRLHKIFKRTFLLNQKSTKKVPKKSRLQFLSSKTFIKGKFGGRAPHVASQLAKPFILIFGVRN
jgi:hypothetical protein